jgi:hypothetical protein
MSRVSGRPSPNCSEVLGGLGEEDAKTDERLAVMLRRHHLDGPVEMIVQNLSDEPETAEP